MILAVLWVLLALAVIVSLFGIVNTLVLSTFERTRELGTLRALGMNRRQVRRMVRHESVITALIGAVLGIAAGLVLAAVIVGWLGKYGLSYAIPAPSLVAVARHRRAGGHARRRAARPPGRTDRRAQGARLRMSPVQVRRTRAASSVERTARSRSSPSNGFARNAVAGSSDPAIVVSPV